MPNDTAPRKFDELDEAARDAIRAKQRQRKEQRLLRKSEPAAKQPRRALQKHDRVVIQGLVKRPEYNEKHGYILRFAEKGERVMVVFDTGEELALKPESLSPEQVDPRRTQISLSEYFGLCSGGHTSVPMPCNEASVAKLMELVRSSDAGLSALLRSHNYFTFQGSLEQQWDPLFYARLSWEGFFVITTQQRVGGQRLRIPLPELQPVYGVLTWPDFERSSLVRLSLRMRIITRRVLQDTDNPTKATDSHRLRAVRPDTMNTVSALSSAAVHLSRLLPVRPLCPHTDFPSLYAFVIHPYGFRRFGASIHSHSPAAH